MPCLDHFSDFQRQNRSSRTNLTPSCVQICTEITQSNPGFYWLRVPAEIAGKATSVMFLKTWAWLLLILTLALSRVINLKFLPQPQYGELGFPWFTQMKGDYNTSNSHYLTYTSLLGGWENVLLNLGVKGLPERYRKSMKSRIVILTIFVLRKGLCSYRLFEATNGISVASYHIYIHIALHSCICLYTTSYNETFWTSQAKHSHSKILIPT